MRSDYLCAACVGAPLFPKLSIASLRTFAFLAVNVGEETKIHSDEKGSPLRSGNDATSDSSEAYLFSSCAECLFSVH